MRASAVAAPAVARTGPGRLRAWASGACGAAARPAAPAPVRSAGPGVPGAVRRVGPGAAGGGAGAWGLGWYGVVIGRPRCRAGSGRRRARGRRRGAPAGADAGGAVGAGAWAYGFGGAIAKFAGMASDSPGPCPPGSGCP
ncbi:hypothetical protein NKH77_36075 [Streptomyces sp. M19]